MKELVIVIVTLAGLFVGIKYYDYLYADNTAKPVVAQKS